jgi:hypothetical protein
MGRGAGSSSEPHGSRYRFVPALNPIDDASGRGGFIIALFVCLLACYCYQRCSPDRGS